MNIALISTNVDDWDVVALTVIDANNTDANVVTFDSGQDANSLLRGFTLTGGKNGVYCDNSSSPAIRNCVVTDNNSIGIACVSGSPTIYNNKISGNGAEGIYSSSTTPPEIKVNWIYANEVGIKFVGPTSVATVFNNTVVDNIKAGIHKVSGIDPNINSCIIWGHDFNDLIGCSAVYTCIQDPNDADGTGNFTRNPNFVNSKYYDYHLSITSPCRISGDPNVSRIGLRDLDGRLMSVESTVDPNTVSSFNLNDLQGQDLSKEKPSILIKHRPGGGLGLMVRYVNTGVQDASLVGHWKMDDNTDTTMVEDASVYQLHGAAQQATNALQTAGHIDGALTFNGSSDYIETPSAALIFANDFTISLWFKANDITTFGQHLVWQGVAGGDGWGGSPFTPEMHISIGDHDGASGVGNYLCFYLGESSSTYEDPLYIKHDLTGGPFDTAIWHHVVVVVENLATAPTATMYLDNSEIGVDNSEDIEECDTSREDWNKGFMIGSCGNPAYFDGAIDDVMTFSRSLIEQEVDTLYHDGVYRYLGNGKSWVTPFRYLQTALNLDPIPNAILVAKGTYYPVEPEQDPSQSENWGASFEMKSGLVVYGGLVGIEDLEVWDVNYRHIEMNKTILSGDIGTAGDYSDNSYHVVTFDSAGEAIDNDTILDGFTIEAGNARASDSDVWESYGGGILCCSASPRIGSCTITDNRARAGAGMHLENCASPGPIVAKCIFSNNQANAYGGGVFNYLNSNPVFIDCQFVKNDADMHAGGMDNVAIGYPELINCVFSENSAEYTSGALRSYAGTSIKATNCVFSKNTTNQSYGGAMVTGGNCYATLTNCTFSKNDADTSTGGIQIFDGDDVTITNCIFWGNSDSSGTGESAQINVSSGSAAVSNTCIEGLSVFSGNDNTGDDPKFVNANDPDGPDDIFGTLDDGLALTTESTSCIDDGDNTAVPNDDFDLDRDRNTGEDLPYDVAGVKRIKDGDYSSPDDVDMGAYEFPWVWFVDGSVGTSGTGQSWDQAFKTMDDALDQVFYAGGEVEIWVAAGQYIPEDREGWFVEDSVRFYGHFQGNETNRNGRSLDDTDYVTTLSGDNGFCYNMLNFFYYRQGAYKGVVDGFTITGSDATGELSVEKDGGGIWIEGIDGSRVDYLPDDHINLTISNCTFRDNKAERGGGIYSLWCLVTVTDCNFIDNEATHYGGAFCSENSVVSFKNCLFAKNTATGDSVITGKGGALYNGQDFCGSLILNCTFTDNQAGTKTETESYEGRGGAIFSTAEPVAYHARPDSPSVILSCAPQIKNSIFWANKADYGGEFFNQWAYRGWYNDQIYLAQPLVSYSSVNLALNGAKCAGLPSLEYGPWAAWKPYFEKPAEDDYNLKDYSPCIDIGDPESPYYREPEDNGDRINLGRYGNTDKATVFCCPSIRSGDGLPEDWVDLPAGWVQQYLDGEPSSALGDDPDHDWLTNLGEYLLGADPLNPDTDGDFDEERQVGRDGWELKYGFDPCTQNDWDQIFVEHTLPFFTSFEQDEGYYPGQDLHLLDGWQVVRGYARVVGFQPAAGDYFQYVSMRPNTSLPPADQFSWVWKSFADDGDHHKYVRFRVRPVPDTWIELYDNSGTLFVRLRFDYDGAFDIISVNANDGATGVLGSVYYDTDQGRVWPIDEYDDFKRVEIKLNWEKGYYEVFVGEFQLMQYYGTSYGDGTWDFVNVGSGQPSTAIGSIVVVSTDMFYQVYGQEAAFDSLSISDYASTTPYSGAIDSPCYCDTITQARVPVKGHIHWGKLGKYEIKYWPAELGEPSLTDLQNGEWYTADTGYTEVESDGTLGYWYTSSIPNGYYYLGLVAYDDAGVEEPECTIEQGPIAVMTEQKANTFRYQEEPDISVPWPGLFPFELRRMYNNNRRIYTKPLPNGWTHNFQMTLTEDTRYYWDAQDNFLGLAYLDWLWLAYGDIWVTYPDGSKRLFRHVSDEDGYADGYVGDPSVYYPCIGKDEESDELIRDKSGDRILRYSYEDESLPSDVGKVVYVLKQRDGMEYRFQWTYTYDRPPIGPEESYPYPSWALEKVGLVSVMDRFENKLVVAWHPTKDAVASVTDPVTNRKIEFDLDSGDPDYYGQARLVDSDVVTVRKVTYDWDQPSSTFTVTKESTAGTGVFDPTSGLFDDAGTHESDQAKYVYDVGTNLITILRSGNTAISVEYDSYGNVKSRNDYIESGSSLLTQYAYRYGPEDELQTEEKTRWGPEPDKLQWRRVTIEHDKKGKVTDQYVEKRDLDGSPVKIKDVTMKYDDDRFTPYEIQEVFDGRTRKTENDFMGSRDVITEQKISEGSQVVAYSEMDYHPNYDLLTKKTTWQALGSGPDPSQGASGKVETCYDYGDTDGIPIANNYGKYLVKERVLVAEGPDTYAEKQYKYRPSGLVTDKIETVDGEQLKTMYGYDGNGYMILEEVELVVDSGNYQWIKKFYYDDIGQLILEANHRGGVKYNHYDAFGRVWKAETYEDPGVGTREHPYYGCISGYCFEPSTYENQLEDIVLTSETYYGYDDRGNRIYEEKIRHSYDIDDIDTGNKQFEISGDLAWQFPVGTKFRVARSTANDGIYTVLSVTETSGQTVITVADTLDGTVDGVLQVRGTTIAEYTIHNKVKTVTYDDDSRVEHEYDNRGLKTKEWRYDAATTDWRGIKYEYDHMDRLTRRRWYKNDSSQVFARVLKEERTEYYDSGKKKREELYGSSSGAQKVTEYQYDILDRMTQSVVDPDSGGLQLTIDYGYDDAGNLIYKVAPEGNVAGEPGNYMFYDYDNANRRIKEYFVEPHVTDIPTTYGNATVKKEMTYYENNLVKSTKEYDYDDYGRSNAELAYKEYKYDPLRRLTEVKEAIDNSGGYTFATTQYEYKDNGTFWPGEPAGSHYQVKIADPEGQYTYIEYGPFGRTTGILHPSIQYEKFVYNHVDGTLKSKVVFDPTDADDPEKEITYYRDGYGRLRRVYYPPNNDTYYVEHLYNGFGKRTKFTDNRNSDDKIGGSGGNANKIQYDHDALGRIIKVIDQDGYYMRYSYMADGQKKMIAVYSTSSEEVTVYKVEYDYDAALRLTSVSEPPLGTYDKIADFQYDDNGNRTRITYALDEEDNETAYIDYEYDLDNHLRKFTTTDGPAAYTFYGSVNPGAPYSNWADIDGLGRLVDADEQVTETDEVTTISYDLDYTYDMRSQLTDVVINSWTGDYVYYDNGDLESRTTTDYGSVSFDYDGHQMAGTQAGGGENFSLSWDENGNMSDKAMTVPAEDDTVLTYNWDKKLRQGDKGSATIKLKYDPQGNRIYKDSSGTVRKYVVDIVGRLPVILLEIDPSSGDVDNSYIYAHSQVIAKHDRNGSAASHANKSFYLHDRLGSVRQIISWNDGPATVNVDQMYTYKPFGEMLESDGSADNPFMFTGQWFDSEIAQYYLRARMYDPYLGRFTARDPVDGDFDEPMSLHKYLYCLSDPINKIDLSGEQLGMLPYLGGPLNTLAYRLVKPILDRLEFRNTMIDVLTGPIESESFEIGMKIAKDPEYAFAGAPIGNFIPGGLKRVLPSNLLNKSYEQLKEERKKADPRTPEGRKLRRLIDRVFKAYHRQRRLLEKVHQKPR